MEANGVFQTREGAIVKEPGRDGQVSQWSSAELVTVFRLTRDFLQAEILVLPWAREDHVALAFSKPRSDLRNADDSLLEVAEHLVRPAIHLVALDAVCLAEEEQSPALFRPRHRVSVPSCELVEGRVGKHQRELEFGDGLAEHIEIDGVALGDFRKYCSEKPAVGWH